MFTNLHKVMRACRYSVTITSLFCFEFRSGNGSHIWPPINGSGFMPSLESACAVEPATVQPYATRNSDVVYSPFNQNIISENLVDSHHTPFGFALQQGFRSSFDGGGGTKGSQFVPRFYCQTPEEAGFDPVVASSSTMASLPVESVQSRARVSVYGCVGDSGTALHQKDPEAMSGFSGVALKNDSGVASHDFGSSSLMWQGKGIPGGSGSMGIHFLQSGGEGYQVHEGYGPDGVVGIGSDPYACSQYLPMQSSQSFFSSGIAPPTPSAARFPESQISHSAADSMPFPAAIQPSVSNTSPFPAMALSFGHRGMSPGHFNQPFRSYTPTPFLPHHNQSSPFSMESHSGSPTSPQIPADQILAAQFQRQLLENQLAIEVLQQSLRDRGRVLQKYQPALHAYPVLDPYLMNRLSPAVMRVRETPFDKLSSLLSPASVQSGARFSKYELLFSKIPFRAIFKFTIYQ